MASIPTVENDAVIRITWFASIRSCEARIAEANLQSNEVHGKSNDQGQTSEQIQPR